MPRTPEQQRGIDFEHEVNEALGLRNVPGSGNRHHDRGDGKGRLRVSSKSETKRSWADVRRQLKEAVDMAAGTGEVPALAIEEPDGERLLVMRLGDASTLLTEEARAQRVPKRAEAVRTRSSVPSLLRGET